MLIQSLAAAGLLTATAAHAGAPSSPAQVTRGAYLVNGVGVCNDCHTPMGPKGPMMDKALAGTKLPFSPTVPMPAWADRSAPIAGLPEGYTRAQVSYLLQTGRRPNGTMPRPPMPQYRMNKADADAVAAYLASLKR